MLRAQVLKRDIFADIAIQLKRHPAINQLLIAAHNNVFFQLEAGNTIGEQSTCPVIAVINRHLKPRPAQPICSG